MQLLQHENAELQAHIESLEAMLNANGLSPPSRNVPVAISGNLASVDMDTGLILDPVTVSPEDQLNNLRMGYATLTARIDEINCQLDDGITTDIQLSTLREERAALKSRRTKIRAAMNQIEIDIHSSQELAGLGLDQPSPSDPETHDATVPDFMAQDPPPFRMSDGVDNADYGPLLAFPACLWDPSQEEEEEEGLFKADAVNEEDPEREDIDDQDCVDPMQHDLPEEARQGPSYPWDELQVEDMRRLLVEDKNLRRERLRSSHARW